MKDVEGTLRKQYKSEADEYLFDGLEFDSKLKQKVRNSINPIQKSVGIKGWIAAGRRKWAFGTAAVVMVTVLAVSIPMLDSAPEQTQIDNPGISLPAPDAGSEGSSLSELTTVIVETPEEAKMRFEANLLIPTYIPEGYQRTEIQTTGMEKDTATRVIFSYTSGDKVFTLMEDMRQAGFSFDTFESIQVNGVDGFVNVMPGLTELYWLKDGIQFSIVGPITQEEAMKVAESLK